MTLMQGSLMHYNTRSFKSDKRRPILEFSANEFFQLRANGRGDLHLVTAETTGDVDGLPIGSQKLNTGRAIAKMVVEMTFYLRIEGSLHIFEQQPVDVAAAKCKSKKLR